MTSPRKRRAWTIRRHPAIWLLALLVPAFASMGTASATITTIEPAADPPAAEKTGGGKKNKGKKNKGKKNKGKKNKGKKNKGKKNKADPEPKPQADPAPETPASDEPALLEIPKSTTPSTFEVLPLEVRGKLSKSGRSKLLAPLKSAAESASAPDGPYRLRLAVNTKRKRSYTLTLSVLPAEAGDPLHTFTESCKGCTLDDATGLVDPLFEQALGTLLAPEEPSLPSPGSLTIRSVPLGAKITIDGIERGITPLTLELPVGEHTIIVLKPGFAEHRETLAIESDAEQQIEPTLGAIPDAPAEGPKAGRPWTIAGAVVLSLGVAGVGTGVAMILVDEDPMPFKCPDADLDFRGTCRYRYNTLMGGIIGIAAGGLGVAGGIALLIKGRIVTVRARGGKDQASLGLMMRW